MKTAAILLKSGKVSKVGFDNFTCYQIGEPEPDKKGDVVVRLKKIFKSEETTTISELNNIIGFAMLTDYIFIKFETDNSSFVVNGKDISGVEITE